MNKEIIIIISICVGLLTIGIISFIIYWYNRYINRYNYLLIDREKYYDPIIVNV